MGNPFLNVRYSFEQFNEEVNGALIIALSRVKGNYESVRNISGG
jgi:hypothetical protein